MEKRYQVFVSSTYEDLIEERQEVMHALLELDCIPAGMELFPAADEDQWTLIKKVIDDCDYYIVIVGGRYGSVGPSGKSYTQLEYEYALSKAKPVIAFLHKNPESLLISKTEQNEKEKLKQFRSLLEQRFCKYWSAPLELSSLITRSLVKLIKDKPAVGWIRADMTPNQRRSHNVVKLEKKLKNLQDELKQYQALEEKLKQLVSFKTYLQPVILVGPRLVGKTSLVMQWYAPWENYPAGPTIDCMSCQVPLFNLKTSTQEPLFANSSILVSVNNHLALKVHDFPGELSLQKIIRKVIIEETERFRCESGKNLGVVLVCMFDAEEAKTGIKAQTQEYYNGELFRELRLLVAESKVQFDSLILVFNKYDKLRMHFPNINEIHDRDLIKLCVDKFQSVYRPIKAVCNPSKVSEVFTVLSREEMHFKNRGAPIVLGEAARAFVRAFVDESEVNKMIPPISTHAAKSPLNN